MARLPSEHDDTRSIDEDRDNRVRPGNTELLGRRRYLSVVGGAVASVTTAATAGTAGARSADSADYDVIEIPSGQHETFFVADGESFENKLIDCTASRATATIAAHGTDWTIRNVGFKGRLDSPHEACLGISDRQGGTSLVENVYIGDGASPGHREGLGIWVAPQHNGHIDIKRTNIQEMGDNSFYCSAPGYNGGTVDIDRCYSANSWVSHFRLGKGNITNCVAVNDERHKDGRGIWAWAPGPVNVDNCHLDMNGHHYSIVAGANGSGGAVNVSNTQYDTGLNGGYREPHGRINWGEGNGTDPENFVPEGCPTSAEEAAAGTGDVDPNPTYDYAMRFEGTGAYFFRTEGGPIEGTDGSDRIQGRIDGESVEIGYDTYLANIGVTDGVEARIVVDGTEYEPTWSRYDGPSVEDWLEDWGDSSEARNRC